MFVCVVMSISVLQIVVIKITKKLQIIIKFNNDSYSL